MQKAQERHGSGEKRQLADRAVEISIARGLADNYRITAAVMLTDHGVNVPQHGIIIESFHASTVGSFHRGIQSGFDHGLRGMVVRGLHTLAKTIVKRVIQIKDDAANEGIWGNTLTRRAFFSGSRC